MTYDVFIVEESVFEPDSCFVELRGLTKQELETIQRIVSRQRSFDFVVRACQAENG